MSKIKVRDWNAVDAHFRRSGYMKDRRSERGGARNTVRDFLIEYDSEECLVDSRTDPVVNNYVGVSDDFISDFE